MNCFVIVIYLYLVTIPRLLLLRNLRTFAYPPASVELSLSIHPVCHLTALRPPSSCIYPDIVPPLLSRLRCRLVFWVYEYLQYLKCGSCGIEEVGILRPNTRVFVPYKLRIHSWVSRFHIKGGLRVFESIWILKFGPFAQQTGGGIIGN
jgi:hypothetical protein